jgi:hypothetical protein
MKVGVVTLSRQNSLQIKEYGKGGVITHTLYPHMNKRNKKKN